MWFFTAPPSQSTINQIFDRYEEEEEEEDYNKSNLQILFEILANRKEYSHRERVLLYEVTGYISTKYVPDRDREIVHLYKNSNVFNDIKRYSTHELTDVDEIHAFIKTHTKYSGRHSVIDLYPYYTKNIVKYYKSRGYNCIREPFDDQTDIVCILTPIIEFVRIIQSTQY